MLFTHKVVNREEVEIDIDGRVGQQARSAKFLGMLIDDRLSFSQHTIALGKKLSCGLGIIDVRVWARTCFENDVLFFIKFLSSSDLRFVGVGRMWYYQYC